MFIFFNWKVYIKTYLSTLKKAVADVDGRHPFKRHTSCLNPLFKQLQMKGQASTIAKELCEHKQWMV